MDKRFVSNVLEALFSLLLLLLFYLQFKPSFEKPCGFHSCALRTPLPCEQGQASCWEGLLPGCQFTPSQHLARSKCSLNGSSYLHKRSLEELEEASSVKYQERMRRQ